MDTNPEDWCTIESDPGVFTELIKGWGVKNTQVEEIYSLEDKQLIEQMGEIFGLVFLFKYQKSEPRECLEYYDQELFFCNQVIQNACATQALLAILLNNTKVQLSNDLSEFKSFVKDFDPIMKGQCLSNQELIRSVHNSFQRPEPFGFYQAEEDKNEKGGDAYHFISYVPFKGKVYELDGLQAGPILIGTIEQGQSWVDVAKNEINRRIQEYSEKEVMFNLLAVIENKELVANRVINQQKQLKLSLLKQAMEKDPNSLNEQQKQELQQLQQNMMEEDQQQQEQNIEIQLTDLNQQYNEIQNVIAQQNFTLEEELQKKEKYRLENIRRKHNYLPFIIELLKMTEKKGKLQELIENAKQRKVQKEQEKKKKKEQQNQDQQK